MAGTIGIKVANGDFYPIIEENSSARKRLVLTTVHDKQDSVQIDLYRSISKTMSDARYIGSIVVGNIKLKQKGDPSIEMLIAIDKNGLITASAVDLESNTDDDRHILNVSLKTLDSLSKPDDFPDFDLEEGEDDEPPPIIPPIIQREETRKFPWLIMICATIFVILAIGLIWYFFLGGMEMFSSGDASKTLEINEFFSNIDLEAEGTDGQQGSQGAEGSFATGNADSVTPANLQDSAPPPEVPVIQAPESPPPVISVTTDAPKRVRPPAPVLSYKVPAVIPKDGANYLIRWGDTLWEIAQAFYRDPWLYPVIAKRNGFSNPDKIITGFWIKIPPLK